MNYRTHYEPGVTTRRANTIVHVVQLIATCVALYACLVAIMSY